MRFITFFHNIKEAASFVFKLKLLGISSRIKLNNIIEKEDLIYDFIVVIVGKNKFKVNFQENIEKDIQDNFVYSIYSLKSVNANILDIADILSVLKERRKIAFVPSEPEEEYNIIGGYINNNNFINRTTDISCVNILRLLNNNFKENLVHITLDDIYKGKNSIISKITASEKSVHFFDGVSYDDINCITEAIKESNLHYYYIASGSFLITLFQALNKASNEVNMKEEKALILSSSKALEDMDKLKDFVNTHKTELYNLNIYSLIINPEEEKNRAINYLIYNNKTNYVVITTAMAKEDIVNLQDFSLTMNVEEDMLKQRIEASLVEVAKKLLEMDSKITCIICSNVSTVMALLKELNTFSLEFNSVILDNCYSITIKLEERKIHILVDFGEADYKHSIENIYRSFKCV